jgi:hypothetical protein
MLPWRVVVRFVAATGITTRRPETIRGTATARRRLSRRAERGRSFSILASQCCAESVDTMPSLLRFLLVLGILAGAGYGAIYALAYWYDPKPREITISVPPDRFTKQH